MHRHIKSELIDGTLDKFADNEWASPKFVVFTAGDVVGRAYSRVDLFVN